MREHRLVGRSTSAATALAIAFGCVAVAQPEPWLHPDNTIHWYDAVAAPAGIKWQTASDSAAFRGGYLATTTSDQENAFVFGLCSRDSLWYERPDSGMLSGPWLGGYQVPGARFPEEGWNWVTGEPFNIRNWSPGEPDDMGGDEDALHFGGLTRDRVPTWDDLSAAYEHNRGYVLEMSSDTTTVGLIRGDSGACPGYTLLAPLYSNDIYLLDIKGRPLHHWHSAWSGALATHLLEDGLLLRMGQAAFNGRIELLDWDSRPVWEFVPPDSNVLPHHDVIRLPSGNLLMIVYEHKTRTEALAAGRDPARLLDNYLLADGLLEVDPATSNVVWEWHAWDHLVQQFDSTKTNYGAVRDHPELLDINYGPNRADWQHCNGLDYNEALDQVIISSRNFSELWIVDHSTTTEEARRHSGGRQGVGGDLLYRWGNPWVYKAGDSASQHFYGQHNARWIAPGLRGSGNILVFNNGCQRPGNSCSTVEEITPPCDGRGRYARPPSGEPFAPASPSWTYGATPPDAFYSPFLSGAQRLPNGNTLVCQGDAGRFFEVGPDSQLVWEYVNPVADTGELYQGYIEACWSVFRTTRYAADYPGLAGRELRPGYPLERYRTPTLALAELAAQKPRPVAGLRVTPNPSPGNPTISYSLPGPGPVRLAVYDNAGRLIRSLASPRADCAAGAVRWDCTDNSGRRVGAGVYVARLTAGNVACSAQLAVTR
jgi:hypothetical protein